VKVAITRKEKPRKENFRDDQPRIIHSKDGKKNQVKDSRLEKWGLRLIDKTPSLRKCASTHLSQKQCLASLMWIFYSNHVEEKSRASFKFMKKKGRRLIDKNESYR
jgi:hypothetical protein